MTNRDKYLESRRYHEQGGRAVGIEHVGHATIEWDHKHQNLLAVSSRIRLIRL